MHNKACSPTAPMSHTLRVAPSPTSQSCTIQATTRPVSLSAAVAETGTNLLASKFNATCSATPSSAAEKRPQPAAHVAAALWVPTLIHAHLHTFTHTHTHTQHLQSSNLATSLYEIERKEHLGGQHTCCCLPHRAPPLLWLHVLRKPGAGTQRLIPAGPEKAAAAQDLEEEAHQGARRMCACAHASVRACAEERW